jgi:hypothetical protein
MRTIRTFGVGLAVGIGLMAAASASWARCKTDVAGTWQVQLYSGMSYSTTISPGGTLQSHCAGCQPQTWTCDGNIFTVFTPSGPTIRHVIETPTFMKSDHGTVSRGSGKLNYEGRSPAEQKDVVPQAKHVEGSWSFDYAQKMEKANKDEPCRDPVWETIEDYYGVAAREFAQGNDPAKQRIALKNQKRIRDFRNSCRRPAPAAKRGGKKTPSECAGIRKQIDRIGDTNKALAESLREQLKSDCN